MGDPVWNFAIGPTVKRALIERARANRTSVKNVVVTELADEFGLEARLGHNRTPSDDPPGNGQLFMRVPADIDRALWHRAAEYRHSRRDQLRVILTRRLVRN